MSLLSPPPQHSWPEFSLIQIEHSAHIPMSAEHPTVTEITPAASPAAGSAPLNIQQAEQEQDEQQQTSREALQANDSNASICRRTPLRTWLIIIALYLVLFIAALDQTIIA
jgi:hypothetical protein